MKYVYRKDNIPIPPMDILIDIDDTRREMTLGIYIFLSIRPFIIVYIITGIKKKKGTIPLVISRSK